MGVPGDLRCAGRSGMCDNLSGVIGNVAQVAKICRSWSRICSCERYLWRAGALFRRSCYESDSNSTRVRPHRGVGHRTNRERPVPGCKQRNLGGNGEPCVRGANRSESLNRTTLIHPWGVGDPPGVLGTASGVANVFALDAEPAIFLGVSETVGTSRRT